MVSRRGLGAVAALIASVVLLTGCVPQGVPAATDRARTQFAEMKAQFATNAPPVRADDFVDYVRTARLDALAEVAIDENGDPSAAHIGPGGRSTRLIYSATATDVTGVVGVIVMGYDSPGWGGRPTTVYSCLTVTFDLAEGGEPEYADAECVTQLQGSIATATHVTLKSLER